MNAVIDGQLSLSSILKKADTREPNEPQVLLSPGQVIWKVVKGDVMKRTVSEEMTWLCQDGKERGYSLRCSNGHDIALNKDIGRTFFYDYDFAKKRAEEFIKCHDVIRLEDVHPIRTVAYQYIRDSDNRRMTAFYSELDNGALYIKEFMTYDHLIMDDKKKKKALKKFMEQSDFKYCNPCEVEYTPVFKNMYRVKDGMDWDYAEAEYCYAIG